MAKFHLPTIEEEMLKKWDEKKVFARVLARNSEKDRKSFVFFEGPPTANGRPGIHHMLARSFKDVILRFRTMQGYRIDRKAGWDTHGLPVELQVEKQLGFTKKQDIENYGIAAFNAKCKSSVWEYRELWEKMTRRTAFWVDMEDPYVTYDNKFVESLWAIFKDVDAKRDAEGREMLYKGYRVTPHCPRCVTSLSSHELAQGYKDVKDPSVFVKFVVAGEAKKFFLVWTTTPWTLPGNVALAVGPEVTYVEALMKESGETFVLARERVSVLDGEFEIVKEMKGADLVGHSYAALYPAADAAGAYKAFAADFVSTTDGTGIVHIAPAFGEDDAALGKKENLPTLITVDSTGMMTGEAPGKGRFFKKADDDVKADLTERGLLYKSEMFLHSYPFCWRCDTPILYYAKSSWYIRMSSLRSELQANNAQINWVPSHIKEGRFGEWLKDVKDWAISRERYWGTPLPIWMCDTCEEKKVIGSLADLEAGRPTVANHYFLQRHGEAESNATDTLSSWPEVRPFPLTEKGRAQAVEAGAKLKDKGITRIYASPVSRTKETVEIIAKELGFAADAVVFDERLREIGFGKFNGGPMEPYHNVVKVDGFDRFRDKPDADAETLSDVRARMVDFIKEMERTHAGERILIVSHGDPIWMLGTTFREQPLEKAGMWSDYPMPGGCFEMAAPRNLPWNVQGGLDVHRPFIDEVKVACACGGTMTRVPDVADVWFDSGAMPFAQWHYPFENAERIDEGHNFPADYISEAIDQTRGWFYTLLAVSTLLGKKVPPYKNVICLGHVLDGKGQKMSKSKGNVIEPFEAVDKWGADCIRWYMFTVNQPGEPKRFDERAVDEVTKKVFLILWNMLTYWQMFAGEGTKAPATRPQPTNVVDKWVLSELAALSVNVTAEMEAYNVIDAGRAIAAYITTLSTWYVRRSRDRFKTGTEAEKAESVATLGYVLLTLSKLMAPFTPFLADELYAAVGGSEDSVHLDSWNDKADDEVFAKEHEDVRSQMEMTRMYCSLALEQRAAVGIAVRQVLASATVRAKRDIEEWMKDIIAEEVNVKEVLFESNEGDVAVVLDTVLTPELKREGAAREMTRQVNDLRKTAKLSVGDRIVVRYSTEAGFWKEVLAEHGESLKEAVKADRFEESAGEGYTTLEVADGAIAVGIEKV